MPNESSAPLIPPLSAQLEQLVHFHRALGGGTRMKILWMLMDGERCVGDLARAITMTESTVSRQLQELRIARVVKARRDKRNTYYSINDAATKAVLIQTLEHIEKGFR